MTEQQMPKLLGVLAEHQEGFEDLSVFDAQWAIQNTREAISLFVAAVANRGGKVLTPAVTTMAMAAYFRHFFTFTLGPTNGKDTHTTASKVFRSGFTKDFESWGVVFSGVAPQTKFIADELIRNGKFSDFLGDTATELEKRRILGSQLLKLCRDHSGQLRGGSLGNFFVLTKNDEPVNKDISNVLVADVRMYGVQLNATLGRIERNHIWRGEDGHHVFTPSQSQ